VTIDPGGAVHVSSRDTLPALPGGGNSIAKGMNGLGQVVGWSYVVTSGPNHAVLWTPGAAGWTIEELGVLPGDYSSSAEGINDLGQVVGTSTPRQGCVHAVLWTTQGGRVTGMRALETPDQCPEAWAINNQSQVIGRMVISHRSEAAMWTLRADGSTATIRDLGRLAGTGSSLAIGLSAEVGGMTEVAGLSRASDNLATLWTVR
jgi:probable HAF family extracellular repeat protein